MTELTLRATKAPNPQLALTNCVFVHPDDAALLTPKITNMAPANNYVKIKGWVFSFQANEAIGKGTVGFNNIQRTTALLSLNEPIPVSTYVPEGDGYLFSVKFEVDFYLKSKATVNIDVDEVSKIVLRDMLYQFFQIEQKILVDFQGTNLQLRVIEVEVGGLEDVLKGELKPNKGAQRGILMKQSSIQFVKAQGCTLRLVGDSGTRSPIIRPDWNFEAMGIGGLDKEFSDIFRRAFASRVFPQSVVSKLGIKHVKGLLLFGPPGTGKTLMARQIGKMLNGKEPKIVNGPEILNKYVGQSEENIRNLFKDAEQEYKERGDDSDLHIIIFDEIDAICKARGSRNDGTGVGDTVVNQLLSKIDGVEALNNILVIGMTNRKDLIDEALLRPGRLEVHMEIGLPDEKGRLQIFRIHTKKMSTNGLMDPTVDLEELAALSKNFSGAEIEGLVKSACAFSFTRHIDASNLTKPINPDTIKITRDDFLRALDEVKPAFGVSDGEFETILRGPVIDYGSKFQKLIHTIRLFVQQVQNSDRTPLVSVLLEGAVGCGKTTLAVKVALDSGFPFVKLISPETMVGLSEVGKCNKITKIFEDSYKSPLSVIVVDDIERLLDYVPIGPRFSNAVLQTLLVLLKRMPPRGRKLLILGTSSNKNVLQDMDFMNGFNAVIRIPEVSPPDEIKSVLTHLNVFAPSALDQISKTCTRPVAIKKLLMVAEMALSGGGTADGVVDRFLSCMVDYGA
jgi:vesicle-fusing ATPase